MKEVKINPLISLKLDIDEMPYFTKTKVLVKGRADTIWSSDLCHSDCNENNKENEFNSRCSIMKEWVASEYDTTLIQHDVAFRVLSMLFELEEPIAKRVFKKEIMKRLLGGESKVIGYLLVNRYLKFFNQEELVELFDERNLDNFSEGKISPYYLKKVKEFDEHFAKLVLKNDIIFYIESEQSEMVNIIVQKDLLNAFSEKELQEFDLQKLNELVFELLKGSIDYYIKNYYYLEDVFNGLKKECKFLIFRTVKSSLFFFWKWYTDFSEDQKLALVSYLLVDQNEINQLQFEEIQIHLKDLDWAKINEIILKNFSRAYGTYKKKVVLNEKTIHLLEKSGIPFLNSISEEIKKFFDKIIENYEGLYDENDFNLFGVLLENNPQILLHFLLNHYPNLETEQKYLFMTIFIVNKESPIISLKSLKERYEQLDLNKFSKIVGNVIWYSINEYLEEKSFEKLGEIGIKIILNVLMIPFFDDVEVRDSVASIAIKIGKKNKTLFKKNLIECLIERFQENSYEEIGALFDTKVIDLLNKDDMFRIYNSSGTNFLKIINKMLEDEFIPSYLENVLVKLGPEGGDLFFKLTQKREYLDDIMGIMKEMGEDLIEPFIKNVVINEYNYKYGDWGYKFVEEFFKIFSKDQIKTLFESTEYDIINRLVEAYNPSNEWDNTQEIITFLIEAYEKLDYDTIPKIHRKLTESMKEEISICFHQAQDFVDSHKMKKYNEILKIIGHQNESIIDLLYIFKDISGIPLFEDLRDLINEKEFNPPGNMVNVLSDIRILLEEHLDLFSPENYGSEDKYYIIELFYEFEKLFQYIIFGYYSININQILQQLTHLFEIIIFLNDFVYNETEKHFQFHDIYKLLSVNYEYNKRKVFFLKEPVWMDKHRDLFKKLNLEPRPYPTIRVRWWNDERGNIYINERNNNLQNEFAYYFKKRRCFTRLIKWFFFDFSKEKLIVKTNKNLNSFYEQKIKQINDNPCEFRINEKNAIRGLSLNRRYYRQCALEFLQNIKPEFLNKTVSDFIGSLSKINRKEIIDNFKKNLFQKSWKEIELAAEDFGEIDKKFKDKTFSQIISGFNEETKQNILNFIIEDFPSYENKKPKYYQLKLAIEGLIGINNTYSRNFLAHHLKDVIFSDLKKKISIFFQESLSIDIPQTKKNFLEKNNTLLNTKDIEKVYNFSVGTILAISPNGIQAISSNTFGTAIIWEINTGELISEIKDHSGVVNAVFSNDGNYIFTSSKDYSIKLWDITNLELIRIFKGHKLSINKLCVSPNNKSLVSCSKDGTLNIWDVDSGVIKKSFSSLSKNINSENEWEKSKESFHIFTFTSDCKYVIGGFLKGSVKIWEFSSKKLIHNLNIIKTPNDIYNKIDIVHVYSEPKKILAVHAKNWTPSSLVELWDLDSGELIRVIGLFQIKCVLELPSGQTLLCGINGHNTLWIFDLDNNQIISKLTMEKKIIQIYYIPKSYHLLIKLEKSDAFILNFREDLKSPYKKPYPVKKRQYFCEMIYSPEYLRLSSMGIQEFEQIEGLDELYDVKQIFIDNNELPIKSINKIGGIDDRGMVNHKEKFIQYYKSLKLLEHQNK